MSRKSLSFWLLTSTFLIPSSSVLALPPAEDVPEEVMRSQIITEARSPIDGKRVSAAEYAAIQSKIQERPPVNPNEQVSPQVRKTIGLLRLRKFIKTVFPFIPIR
jgi:hypothetical protein